MSNTLKNIGATVVAAATIVGSVSMQTAATSQNLDQDGVCTMQGGDPNGTPPTDPAHLALNESKNRYQIPADSDFAPGSFPEEGNTDDESKAWDTFLGYKVRPAGKKSGEATEMQSKAFHLRGYVLDAIPGGLESCNCKQDDPHRDVHIYVSKDPITSATKKADCVIVEVTPRVRHELGMDDNWTAQQLHATIVGKHVDFQGWLVYDWEHINNSANEGGHASNIWRHTCWEIHPVTGISIADATATDASTPQDPGNAAASTVDGTKTKSKKQKPG